MEQPYRNHNGGHLVVDAQGRLLIGFGDGGLWEDPHDNAQDLGTWLGAILRIDPRGDAPSGIPAENPFVGDPKALDEILLWGLRNPWRFALDPTTGDLWIADVGQNTVEEVTRIPAADIDLGLNLGWPAFEGDLRTGRTEPDEHRPPDLTYERTAAAGSGIGGVVYRGEAIADLAGTYVFGDYCDGRIRLAAIQPDGSVAVRLTELTVPLLASFAEDGFRNVYALSLAGGMPRRGAGGPPGASRTPRGAAAPAGGGAPARPAVSRLSLAKIHSFGQKAATLGQAAQNYLDFSGRFAKNNAPRTIAAPRSC